MALVKGLAVSVLGLLGAAASRLVVDDFKAWLPRIRYGFINRAVLALPAAQQERYREEWQSHLNEIPGEIGKLFVCLGFLSASRRMSSILEQEPEPESEVMASTADFFRDPDGVHIVKGCTGPISFLGEAVIIENGAVVCGDVQARSVEIRNGTVRGNIFARDAAVLREGCKLVGDVTTRRMSIHDGSYFKGGIDIRHRLDDPKAVGAGSGGG